MAVPDREFEFAAACRRHEHDDLLVYQPDTDPGTPKVRHQWCFYSELVSEQERNPRVHTARRVVSEAEAALRGAERGGVRVDGLFHYGAVDLDPQLLVVWILLSGKPDDQLPEWMPVVPAEVNPVCPIDYEWLVELRGRIVQRFRAAGWPRPQDIAVYADGSHRVDAAGGSYCKG